MKKYILIQILCLCCFLANAQQNSANCVSVEPNPACCNGQIITDPTIPYNPDRGYLNQFDWKTNAMKATFTNGGQWDINNNSGLPINFINPFFTDQNDPALKHINFYKYPSNVPRTVDKLDFQPKNGWELLHRNFGYEQDETTVIPFLQRTRESPYFILYNRYTGKLRYIGSLGLGSTSPNQIVTNFQFRRQSNGLLGDVSGLFGMYGEGGLSAPLDKETKAFSASQASDGVRNRKFFTADLDMAYDPCICNTTNDLEFEFAELNTASILLEGRLIGINTPLGSSGTSPLTNSPDFLNSVYKRGSTVKGGMQTYHNIDALVGKYKVVAKSPLEAAALDIFKNVFKSGLNAALGPVDNILGGAATSILTGALNGQSILGYAIPTKDLKISGFGIAGALSSSLTTALFPDQPPTPNISFLEAEGVFSGTMTQSNPLNADNIVLAHPGSKESTNLIVPWQKYPFYNEALGVFAITKTPKVSWSRSSITHPFGTNILQTFITIGFQKLDFVFNPSAEVDVAKTKIVAALIVDSGSNPTRVTNAGKVLNGATIYMTPFVPLEYLNQVPIIMEWESGPIALPEKISVRLMIEYTFKQNRYGVVNKSFQILTYPVDILPVKPPVVVSYRTSEGPDTSHPDYVGLILRDLSVFPQEKIVGSMVNTVHPPQTNGAWSSMIMTGVFQSPVNQSINFDAPTVTVVPTPIYNYSLDTVLSPQGATGEIVISAQGLKFLTPKPVQQPLSEIEVKSFCNSNRYKAKIPEARYNIADNGNNNTTSPSAQPKQEFENTLTAFPNPTTGETTIRYEVQKEGSSIEIFVSSMLGERVITLANVPTQGAGVYEVHFDASKLAEGIYIYTLLVNGERISKKLVVSK